MRRIGEILLERGWIDADALAYALAQQPSSGMRTCSYLVHIGAIDLDIGARALGEQHGVAAALRRHLARRDRELAATLPAGAAQLYAALPLGRMANGDIIVCVRDPKPELRGVLQRAMKEKVVLAVAPASQLEAIIEDAYGDEVNEFDVDLGTQPIPIALELDATDVSDHAELDPLDDDSIPELDNLQLVELDDTRVSRDPTQSGHPMTTAGSLAAINPPSNRPTPLPASPRRPQVSGLHAVPQSRSAIAIPPEDPSPASRATPSTTIRPPGGIESLARGTQPPSRQSLDANTARSLDAIQLTQLAETLASLAAARTHDDIADAAMRFVSSRWRAALLVAVEGHEVTGLRGHGAKLSAEVVRSISISLDSPSIIEAAYRVPGRLIRELPVGGDEIHDHLEPLLAVPRFPAAVGIVVGNACDYVLLVGDPNGHDVEAAAGDLNRLATALSAAYTRLERR
ncbi:MAG: hypothetical protein ACKV2T_06315 [Kofleriaceae bacterium]